MASLEDYLRNFVKAGSGRCLFVACVGEDLFREAPPNRPAGLSVDGAFSMSSPPLGRCQSTFSPRRAPIIPLTSLSVQATLCMNKRMRGARFLMKSLTLREVWPSGRRPRLPVVPPLLNSIPPFPKQASDSIRSAHGRVPRNLPPALRPSCRLTAGPSATSPGWPSTSPSKDSST